MIAAWRPVNTGTCSCTTLDIRMTCQDYLGVPVARTRTSSAESPESTRALDESTPGAIKPARARKEKEEVLEVPSKRARREAREAAAAREPRETRGAGKRSSAVHMRRLRQILLVAGLLVCAFLAVALGSYHATDPSFSQAGAGPVRNLAGPAGAWMADVLLQVFGYGTWGGAVLAFLLARKLAGRPIGGVLAGLAWSASFWAVLAMISLLLPAKTGAPFPPGGLIGMSSATLLAGAFGPVGSWIVIAGALLSAAPFAVGTDWEHVAARVMGGLERSLPRVGEWSAERARAAVGGVASAGAAVAGRFRRDPTEEVSEEEGYTDEGSELYTDEGSEVEDDRSDAADRSVAASGLWPAMRTAAPPARPLAPVRAAREPAVGPEPSRAAPPVVRATEERPASDRSMVVRPRRDRGSSADPTQVASPDLVEVQWDPTDLPQRGAANDTRPMPRRGAPADEAPSVVDRVSGEVLMADERPAPKRGWGVPEPLDEDPSDLPEARPAEPIRMPARAAPARPEPARPEPARPAARSAMAGSAANAVKIHPGALESGGEDDGLALIARPAQNPYEPPHLGLLDVHERDVAQVDEVELHELARTLEAKLADFGVKGEVMAIRPGPVITTFEYQPAAGIKISRISSLSDDIAMALKALRVRIVAPIPGKGVVGIEIPNKHRQTVWLRDLFAGDVFRKSRVPLPVALGKSVEGAPRIADLASMPHLLVGGTTGSGKSVGVNAMLLSMLFTRTPEELKLILVDPKMLEFELYRDIPHLLHPVVTDPRLASAALKWACTEMDARYALLSRWQTRNIEGYNHKVEQELADWTPAKARRYAPPDLPEGEPPPPPKKLPYIVVVIDELADLMMVSAKDVEESIIRIAQKARAAGIHLIVATQRPSVNVITGLIKANMPSRIAFQVRTKVDGRTILDQNGAENLLGKGDMLFLPPGVSALERLHGPFCTDEEVRRVCDFLRAQGPPNYEAEIRLDDDSGEGEISPEDYDDLYDAAVRYCAREGKASASMIQREFKIGYNRAARMIEIMEKEGVVGQADGARPREVLVGRSTA